MTESEIAAFTYHVLAHYRPEGLLFQGKASLPSVRFGRSLSAIGLAHYPSERGYLAGDFPKITYSRPLFAAMAEPEQRDTVIHEVAHLLVADDWQRRRAALAEERYRAGSFPKGHGLEWKTWMIRMGGKPVATCRDERTNEVARKLVNEKRLQRDGVQLRCRCQEWVLPMHKAARPAMCPKCRTQLYPENRATALACNLFRSAVGIPVPSFSEVLDAKAKGMKPWTTTVVGRANIVRVARELLGEL